MNKNLIALPITILALVFVLPSVTQARGAVVENAIIRLLPGNLPAAGYFTLNNLSDESIILKGAESAIYGKVMMHESKEKDGMVHMEQVSAITLKPGEIVDFKPRSYHLMLMMRREPVAIGDKVSIRLVFENGHHISVDFKTVSPTEMSH